jgi:hypothetical protein
MNTNDTILLYPKTSEPSDCEYAQQKSKPNPYKFFAIYGFLISLMLVSYVATSNLFTKNDTESSLTDSSFGYLPPYNLVSS